MTTTKKCQPGKYETKTKCEKAKTEKQKAESERQLRVGQAEETVYKLQMERTRRSHMTANAICEAHLQQGKQK